MKKIQFELLDDVDYYAQIFLQTNYNAKIAIEEIDKVGGFVRRKDLKDILFDTLSEDKFKKLIKELINHKLIYLDKNYNANILLTAKTLTILREKKIKNKISTDKITDITLDKNRFKLTLKNKIGYIGYENFENEFINLYTNYFMEELGGNIEVLRKLKEKLQKEEILLINLNTIAIINTISVETLKNKLKKIKDLDLYLIDIDKIILDKYYLEEITEKDLEKLKEVTKKYKSIYSEHIDYILI